MSVGIEGLPVGQNAPGDTGQLIGQGGGQLVSMQPGCRLGEPWSEAEYLPIVRSHQDDVGRLDEQGAQVLAAALGYASKDRSATGAVLAWNKTEPGSEVAPIAAA